MYPSAPWTLYGHALLTANLVDSQQARSQVPAEFELVSVLPGKTIGGVYVAQYLEGSVLTYSELIVVAGLVRHGSRIGPWVSHIYVDNPDSVAGGREIWGLPKELAEFKWVFGQQSQVSVRQGDRTLCELGYGTPMSFWQIPLSGRSFSVLNRDLLWFQADTTSRPGIVRAELTIPSESPFASLHLEQPWLTFSAQDLRLTVHAPAVIGFRTAATLS